MKNKVYQIVASIFNVSVENVDENSSPDTIEEWDSIKHMNLVLAIEQEFNVQFDDEQAVMMLSVELVLETLKECGVS